MKDTIQVELKSKDIKWIKSALFKEYFHLRSINKEYNTDMEEVIKLKMYFHNLNNKNSLQAELRKLKTDLLEQIKGYETQPVETSDECFTQGWLEAIEHVQQLIRNREYTEQLTKGESK